jgi:hypothetical protein
VPVDIDGIVLPKEIPMTDTSKLFWAETFEDAPVGGTLYDCPPMRTCRQSTIVESGGRRAGVTTIKRGQSGYGDWGFTIRGDDFDKTRVGDEIWWSQEMMFPKDFDFWTDHGSLKLFRIGKVDMAGKNRGCVDVQIRSGDQDWRCNVEFKNDDTSWETFTGGRVVKGKAQRFECYTYLHPTNGIIRMYLDGVLFGESSRRCTMNSDEKLLRVLWSTYWNGNAPKTQSCALGEGYIAIKNSQRDDSKYLDDDGHGNKYIGNDFGGGGEPINPPVDPVDPVDPPVDPVDPPELPDKPPLSGAVTLVHGDTTVQIGEKVIVVSSDKDVIVT